MGDTQTGLGRETANNPREDSQTRAVSLLGALKENLEAHADAQERAVGGDPLLQERLEVGAANAIHAIGHSPLPWEHDHLSLLGFSWSGGKEGIGAGGDHGTADATKVTHPVIDDGHPRAAH
jgi:hypothetical protein